MTFASDLAANGCSKSVVTAAATSSTRARAMDRGGSSPTGGGLDDLGTDPATGSCDVHRP